MQHITTPPISQIRIPHNQIIFLSFHQDGVVCPYNIEEVTGDRILKSLDGGRFADTDTDTDTASYLTREAVDAKKESLIRVIMG